MASFKYSSVSWLSKRQPLIVATSGTDKFIDKCTILTRKDYSEFAIPYVPNFTIIQKDKSGVVIDMNIYLEIIEDAILNLVWHSGNSAIKRTSMLNNNIFSNRFKNVSRHIYYI
ncbi:hypothetical protein BAZO_08996 [Schinkia azotoformans LMG 9581]|uniref:Uncharacterized protein n=1 Tax=Schinkia azotoformans LMG 9581 TaxID=1131731 RepID=K6E272_SCHAZ|nr:hypothetical protein BAZO_08996 [Schinkia azotoformans LMG 9581]